MHESEGESEVTQSCPTLSDPMDCSRPGFSAHGIFQARVLAAAAKSLQSNARVLIYLEGEAEELTSQYRTSLAESKEKAMAPHSSTLAWKILWMEEPGRLQSMGSLRVGHD